MPYSFTKSTKSGPPKYDLYVVNEELKGGYTEAHVTVPSDPSNMVNGKLVDVRKQPHLTLVWKTQNGASAKFHIYFVWIKGKVSPFKANQNQAMGYGEMIKLTADQQEIWDKVHKAKEIEEALFAMN